MALSILIATPSAGFGELILQVLQEAGGYSLSLATSGAEAIDQAAKNSPELCILDTELGDLPVDEVVQRLRQHDPQVRLLFIPPDGEGAEADLSRLQPDGLLSKPFYLPDLISTVEGMSYKPDPQPVAQQGLHTRPLEPQRPRPRSRTKPNLPPPPEWLQDVSLAAQHLTRLSLESSSQAALITRGDENIWAYAGELPQPAAEELARVVSRHWTDGGGSDLARFARLQATGGEYMLYATGLGGDFVLALVFDAAMPFSKIRSQANKLARALASAPAEPMMHVDTGEMMGEEGMNYPAQPLLDDVPPPFPSDWIPQQTPPDSGRSFLDELIGESGAGSLPSVEAFPYENAPVANLPQTRTDIYIEEAGPTRASGIQDYEADTVVSGVSADETLPSGAAGGKALKLEPPTPTLVNLTYACVLIPRLPQHHLTGNLAARLSEWVTQISLAFGWRLEQLAIRPDYLQWMVNVPPSTSPGYLMRIIRQHTSRRMFAEFPALEGENPSGDFWAPGYLIMSGNQPPAALIKDFIRQTRTRQGIASRQSKKSS